MKIYILGIICLIILSSCNDSSVNKHSGTATNAIEIKTNNQLAFDADGYYFPVDSIKYKNFILENVLIATTDKTNDFGDKQVLFAQIELVDITTGENWEETTKDFELKNKDFRAVFNVKNIGTIKLTAQLLGKNGPINDKIDEDKTIVMKGKFEINDDYKRETEFKYFAGD